MTQLELPPVSFARYLELLKRRRWQVVPISILGLLIGATIAFFVPRYYVVSTVVRVDGSVLITQPGEDPMGSLIGEAKIAIPFLTADVLAESGWREANEGTWDEKRAFAEDVRERITVVDQGPTTRGRTTAHIRIGYKDRSRERANDFLTRLRDLWIERNEKDLAARADREEAALNRKLDEANRVLIEAEEELTRFQRANDVNPQDFLVSREQPMSELSKRIGDADRDLGDVRAQLEGAKAAKTRKEELLAIEKPMRRVTIGGGGIPAEIQAELRGALLKMAYYRQALDGIQPAHKNYRLFEYQLGLYQKRYETLLAAIEKTKSAEIEQEEENPRYTALRTELDGVEADIESLERRERTLVAQLAADRARYDKMPDLFARHRTLLDWVERARDDRKLLEGEARKLAQSRRAVSSARAYEITNKVWGPPRPTDPNIFLLALAGSAIGLAIAIGLILLLDVLQANFKTIADVEHALKVPVLGGLSHMVTREQQARTVARRTRAGVVAAGFLLLTISLVTIYYVAPTRLPTVVRDALGVILGARE
jgi:uncharacterized protein involved in exopolysaccharide biosynthesis